MGLFVALLEVHVPLLVDAEVKQLTIYPEQKTLKTEAGHKHLTQAQLSFRRRLMVLQVAVIH